MTQLQQTIDNLTKSFASSMAKAIGNATLADLAGLSTEDVVKGGLARRAAGRPKGSKNVVASVTAATTGSVANADAIVNLLKANKGGLRQEEIRAKLGIDKPVAVKLLTQALASKQLRKIGQRRATRYLLK